MEYGQSYQLYYSQDRFTGGRSCSNWPSVDAAVFWFCISKLGFISRNCAMYWSGIAKYQFAGDDVFGASNCNKGDRNIEIKKLQSSCSVDGMLELNDCFYKLVWGSKSNIFPKHGLWFTPCRYHYACSDCKYSKRRLGSSKICTLSHFILDLVSER